MSCSTGFPDDPKSFAGADNAYCMNDDWAGYDLPAPLLAT